MKSPRLVNGDLQMDTSGDVRMVTGRARLVQELTCWLFEPLGTDVHHPRFGSKVPLMVGDAILSGVTDELQSEIARVLGNYITYQNSYTDGFSEGNADDFFRLYSMSEILASVEGISVVASRDKVSVRINLKTMAGESVSLTRALT